MKKPFEVVATVTFIVRAKDVDAATDLAQDFIDDIISDANAADNISEPRLRTLSIVKREDDQ